MSFPKLLAASLLTVLVSLPALADFRPGPVQIPGPGRGDRGPDFGRGPDMRDRCRFDPRDCGWGRGPMGPPRPGFPPLPPPPPSFGGLCQGNFSGSFADGRQVMISVNGAGQFVAATVMVINPQVTMLAQGVCTSINGVSQLSLTLQNGVVEAGQIYLASDGRTYFDGTENRSNQRFILQRQQ